MNAPEEQAAAAPEPKKKKTLLIVLLSALLLVFGAGGFVTYSLVLKEKPPAETAAETAAAPETPKTQLFPLDPFIVNLVDDQGIRYMKLQLQLELKDLDPPSMEREIPKIRDSLVVLLSSKRFDEISTMEGKARLREEILYRLDRILGAGKAEAVYFTDFVVQ
jgi:flagellar FliL protein